jgi:hypothetical protein
MFQGPGKEQGSTSGTLNLAEVRKQVRWAGHGAGMPERQNLRHDLDGKF